MLEHHREAKAQLSEWLLHPDGGRPADGRRPPNPHPLDNVVGVGIGEQTTRGRPTGRRALKVYVEAKFPAEAIAPANRLPASFAGLIVDVEEVGLISVLGARVPTLLEGRGEALCPGRLVRVRSRRAGDERVATLGGFVSAGARVLGLSSAHGPAESGDADMHAAAVGREAETVAELDRATALTDRNLVDGSTWTIVANGPVDTAVPSIGLPCGVEPAAVDMLVHKCGGASGYTVGRVVSIDTDVRVHAADRTMLFLHQLVIGTVSGVGFALPGDSGSLIANRATGNAVGLLVAGSHTVAIANHLNDVLDALGVRLVVAPSVPPPAVAVHAPPAGDRAPAAKPTPPRDGPATGMPGVPLFARLAP